MYPVHPGTTFQLNSRALLTPAGISSTLLETAKQTIEHYFLRPLDLNMLGVHYLGDGREKERPDGTFPCHGGRSCEHALRTGRQKQTSYCPSALCQLLCDLGQGP